MPARRQILENGGLAFVKFGSALSSTGSLDSACGSFLEAAETLFAELGFEAVAMTAIAERAGSSVGALYSYFPDKKLIALALLGTYSSQIEEHWQPLFDEIVSLAAENFSERFIDRILEFVAVHPAFLQLLAVPIRLRPKRYGKASLPRFFDQGAIAACPFHIT